MVPVILGWMGSLRVYVLFALVLVEDFVIWLFRLEDWE